MTYSVQNLHIDNELSFTPGATAGYVMAINPSGVSYWTEPNGSIDELSDVIISGPIDNSILVYDNGSGVWRNNVEFYIAINFQEVGVTWSYVSPEDFKINTVDNPNGLTYSILLNSSPYTLGSSISLYDNVEIPGLTGLGFLKLNSELI